jgi:protein-disulfide isomerase
MTMSSRSRALYIALIVAAAVSCKPAPEPKPKAAEPEVESCSAWLDFVCSHVAGQDPLCLEAQEAVSILTSDTCAVAYEQRAFTEAQLKKRAGQCQAVVDKICEDLPGMTRFCKRLQKQAARYTPNFCVDMMRKYPETLAQAKQEVNAPRLKPEQAAQLYQGEPPAFGPADAPIQIVEFADYESQYSPQTAAIIRTLAAKYGDRLHFVLRQFPLPDNKHAHEAAQAALAAHAQGKYWPMHDKLLENRTHLERADLLKYAKELGLNTAQLKAALDRKQYAAAVDADLALGKALEVVGMPTVFVNNERITNSVSESAIVEAIEEYLALPR